MDRFFFLCKSFRFHASGDVLRINLLGLIFWRSYLMELVHRLVHADPRGTFGRFETRAEILQRAHAMLDAIEIDALVVAFEQELLYSAGFVLFSIVSSCSDR